MSPYDFLLNHFGNETMPWQTLVGWATDAICTGNADGEWTMMLEAKIEQVWEGKGGCPGFLLAVNFRMTFAEIFYLSILCEKQSFIL